MNSRPLEWLAALAAGAALMYFLDPVLGRRRRALARDQIVHMQHEIAECTQGAVKDLGNRTYGLYAEARGLVERRKPAPSHPVDIELS
jgi:hypothetical protein